MKKIIRLTESDLVRIVKKVILEEKNSEVIKIQKELVAKGYDLGNYGPNKDGVDGIMGPLTRKAYEKEFKKPYKKEESDNVKKIYKKSKDNLLETKYGKISLSKNKTAPLLMVYGGIPVGGRESGDYMWDYVDTLTDKYNIFVANSHRVNGNKSYNDTLDILEENGVNPSYKILYLFSGGYGPGMDILQTDSNDFNKVLLVDIWMKGSKLGNFFVNYTNSNSGKVSYFYTSFGANNQKARDSIASTASTTGKSNNHMDTNRLAVNSL